MAALILLGVVGVTGVAFLLAVRKMGQSRRMVLATKTDAVRARALADAATQTADRMAGVAEQALNVGRATKVTEQALNVAQEIHEVRIGVDKLLDQTGAEQPTGRHALRAVPDERYIA